MVSISKSQKGAESAHRGMDYQKRFAALLCCEMLLQHEIERVTCENLEDIEVELGSQIKYYQLKSTIRNSLCSDEIVSSFKFFSDIENYQNDINKQKVYVLVSNVAIDTAIELNFEVPFIQLSDSLKKKIKLKTDLDNTLLSKIFVMKGPALEDIYNTIIAALVKALPDIETFSYRFEEIANCILLHVNKMCSPPTNLFDRKVINPSEKSRFNLDHKSMRLEDLNKCINQNRVNVQPKSTIRISKEVIIKYNIRGTELSLELSNKIRGLIREYKKFEQGDQKQLIYLQKFEEMSKKYVMYKHQEFLSFLRHQFKKSDDKHVILECLYILDRLIIMSEVERSNNFKRYVFSSYFQLLKNGLQTRETKYEYSFFKIQQIFDRLKKLIPMDELCEMYSLRMVEIIKNMKATGLTDNSLWNCVANINQNKCSLQPNIRKWLLKSDEYSAIKNAIIGELEQF